MRNLMFIFILLTLNTSAQYPDSVRKTSEAKQNLSIQSYIIPTVFISYGLISLGNNGIRGLDLSTQAELSEDHATFAAHFDDYSKFFPIIAMYALDLTKLKAKNKIIDQTAMLVISAVTTNISVSALKRSTKRLRPNGAGYSSFPSGHTAVAFAAAEMLHQEFKEQSPWIAYAGYGIAGATGILRMYNNAHWLSDVVAGAGFGMLSTKLTYLAYPYLKHILSKKEGKLQITPTLIGSKLGFNLNYKVKLYVD